MKVEKSDLKPNLKGASRAVATADTKTDLGAAADKVNKADTPHKSQAEPSLSVVLFAELKDKDEAKKAEKALEKVKGVSAKDSKADADKDEIVVRIAGGTKVMASDIIDALKDGGIKASLSKGKS